MTTATQLTLEHPPEQPARPSVTFVPADERGIARILIDRPDDRVNAIDLRMVRDLASAVGEARAAKLKGLVLMSGKPGQFIAGADLKLLGQASPGDVETVSLEINAVLNNLVDMPCPTVAAIGATAFGGGYEVSLACDWRIAADVPGLRVGFPEVRLGIVPGAGGTQRLPRLVGLRRALEVILTSRGLSPRAALRAGLVDEVVHPAVLERAASDRVVRSGKRRLRGGASFIDRVITNLGPLRRFVLDRARRKVLKETGGRYPAPGRAIDAIVVGLERGIAAGQAEEARAFDDLANGPIARNLVALTMLGLHQRGAALVGLPRPRATLHLGVVGAGFMGSGIAQAGALAEMRVRLRDVDVAAVARGLGGVRSLTRDAMRKQVVERREGTRAIGRVSGATDYSGFRSADLVIEAVFEDLATKRRVIGELEEHVRDDAVIASNTSALPIADIAAGARVPERIVGMHFFSPVHRMPLVEVVRPASASDQAIADAVGAAQRFGKTAIVVRDGPGFYTTRVLSVMFGEAFTLLAQGARIEDVDSAMVGFGWPVGPFTLVDEVGLEVALHAGETASRAVGAVPPDVLVKLVAAGFKGKRRGGGFYLYEGKRRVPNPKLREFVEPLPARADELAADRLTLTFVNEAARCLDEGILRSPAEGDLGAVLGLGFPPFLGGPFRWADARGVEMRDALARLAERFGPRFAMSESLRNGTPFYRS